MKFRYIIPLLLAATVSQALAGPQGPAETLTQAQAPAGGDTCKNG